MKLYYASHTRSIRPRWLLEEMGLSYELVRLNLGNQDHKKPEYLRIHPLGQVPALVDGPLTLFESAAICLYLADKHLDKGFAPPVESPDRAKYYQWVFFAVTDLEKPVLESYDRARRPDPSEPAAAVTARQKRCEQLLATLDGAVAKNEFILGSRFSAADVLFGAILDIARAAKLIDENSNTGKYHARLRQRPAYRKARADQ